MRYLFLLLPLILCGCSQKLNHIYETVHLATFGLEDAVLTDAQIIELPYASLYVRIGDGPQAFMVLGFHEQHQAKWFSADGGMIATQHGRIVKTIGLYGQNLEGVSALEQDPLALNLNLASTPKQWRRQVDWSPNYRYNYSFLSEFQAAGSDSLTILGEAVPVAIFIETVTVLETGQQFENRYWIARKDGAVIKSQQALGPDQPSIEITQLKRFKA